MSSSERFEDVLEGVYRSDSSRLWHSLLGYSGDRDIATDAMGEAFAQALRRGSAIREPRAWIWRAAFKIASGELKRKSQLTSFESAELTSAAPEVPRLLEALQALSPRQRVVIILRYYAGYSTSEVAVIAGCTPATVRVHISQARRRIRKLLEEDDA